MDITTDDLKTDILILYNDDKDPSTNQNTINSPDCNHRRAGSTGTNSTGDSITTTDDESDTYASVNATSDIESQQQIDQFDVEQLRYELHRARRALKLKTEEITRLCKIRQDVTSELEDLTASLFEEAHNMVRIANEKQATAEKNAHESDLKVDVLTAEVCALKALVLTSTPSAPNKHLHPQIDRKHRRCLSTSSHFNLKYSADGDSGVFGAGDDVTERHEVDPELYEEFVGWRGCVSMRKEDSAFMGRVYGEDVVLCLRFVDRDLSEKVVEAVENGSILVEAVGDKSKTIFPKKCALMNVQRQCQYRMNICANTGPGPSADSDTWHFICTICRNRIIAVCDFLNYLKYIERGLVKSSEYDIYWEIVKLRKNMTLARLGLTPNSTN